MKDIPECFSCFETRVKALCRVDKCPHGPTGRGPTWSLSPTDGQLLDKRKKQKAPQLIQNANIHRVFQCGETQMQSQTDVSNVSFKAK